MPEKRRVRPFVTLCAALTLDGKLDTAAAWPGTLFRFGAAADCPVLVEPAARGWLPNGLAPLVEIGDPLAAIAQVNAWRAQTAPPTQIQCGGGAPLFRALLEAKLVGDLRLVIRPRIDGQRNATTLTGGPDTPFFPHSLKCRLLKMETIGLECHLHYRVNRRN